MAIQQSAMATKTPKWKIYFKFLFISGGALCYAERERETFYNKIIISTCFILKGKMAKIVFNLFILYYLNHFVK